VGARRHPPAALALPVREAGVSYHHLDGAVDVGVAAPAVLVRLGAVAEAKDLAGPRSSVHHDGELVDTIRRQASGRVGRRWPGSRAFLEERAGG
jgi:hypothetical protein